MARGDTVNQGTSPWPHEHPGLNAQCNQTGCWGRAEVGSEGLIINGKVINAVLGVSAAVHLRQKQKLKCRCFSPVTWTSCPHESIHT